MEGGGRREGVSRPSSAADVEVMETLQRPYDVRQYALNVPSMGMASSHTSHKLTRPTLTQVTLHTAQPTKTIPGHTGFLIFATLTPQTAVTELSTASTAS